MISSRTPSLSSQANAKKQSLVQLPKKLFQNLVFSAHEFIDTDDRGGDFMESLKVFRCSFVAQFETSEISKPAQRSFHDVAGLAQAAAMLTLGPTVRSEERLDATLLDLLNDRRRTVSRVSLEARRFAAGASAATGYGWNFIEHRQGPVPIRLIGRPRLDHQRNSSRVGNHMPLTAFFGAIGGIGSGVAPPKTARTEALSMTARESRIEPRLPKRRNSRRCNAGHTPAWVHSCSRRQQVTPLPQPISWGSMFQGSPLLRMNRIPVKQARFDTGGRPPFGEAVCGGRSGSISFHSPCDNNADISSPPC
jgi:hypothetical protein